MQFISVISFLRNGFECIKPQKPDILNMVIVTSEVIIERYQCVEWKYIGTLE